MLKKRTDGYNLHEVSPVPVPVPRPLIRVSPPLSSSTPRADKSNDSEDQDTSLPMEQYSNINNNNNDHMMKMVSSRYQREGPLQHALSGLSSLYAMVLVTCYIAFAFTELVTFPKNHQFLEKNGFFIFLYLMSVIFLLYVMWFTLNNSRDMKVVENHKSHGSLTIRFGALVFGFGTLVYFILETVSFLEIRSTSPCHYPPLGANVILAMMFVVLQTYLIFVYPRLNLRIFSIVDRFGTMHLVATNIILWLRTLIRESLHEIAESEEEAHSGHASEEFMASHNHGKCNFIGERIKEFEHKQVECMELHNDILGDALLKSSPYLYPFVIEFALIGASVLFVMWRHVGKLPRISTDNLDISMIRKPEPKGFLKKTDASNSLKGILAGIVVFGLAILNLGLFFGLDAHEVHEGKAELYSKITNTLSNLLGIIALIIGLKQIQLLEHRSAETQEQHGDLDLSLLRFTAFFTYLYQDFTVITGGFNHHVEGFPNELHIINGIVEGFQITLQIVFIMELKKKVLQKSQVHQKPGRQVTIFLFLLNISQWIVLTFEIQKVRASLVEASFYGFMPWVIIQRVTLPLAVFFRFHSAVVNIELWKEIYLKD